MDTVGDGDKRDVRRPMNAFLIFCKRHRSIVREKNPDLDNRSVTRILGDLWANLKDEEKLVYTDLAKQYKDAFMKANPDYKWHNPEKVATCPKSGVTLSKPSKGLKTEMNMLPEGSIIPGKLADPCNMGGLSLLLMAGEQQCRIEQNHTSTVTGTHRLTDNTSTVTGIHKLTDSTSTLTGTHRLTDNTSTVTGTHSWTDTSYLTHNMNTANVTYQLSDISTNNQHSAEDMNQVVCGVTNVRKSSEADDGRQTSGTAEVKSITSSVETDGRVSTINKDNSMVVEKYSTIKDVENSVCRQTVTLTKLKDSAQTKPLLYQAVAAPKLPARSLLADAFKDCIGRDGHSDILKDNIASTKMANFENQGHVLENVFKNDTETMETKLMCKVDEKENITQKVVTDVKLEEEAIKDEESPMVTCGKLVVNHIIDQLYSSDLASAARKSVSANKDEVDGCKDGKDNKDADVQVGVNSVVKVELETGGGSRISGNNKVKIETGVGSWISGNNKVELETGVGSGISGNNKVEQETGVRSGISGNNKVELESGVRSGISGNNKVELETGVGSGISGNNKLNQIIEDKQRKFKVDQLDYSERTEIKSEFARESGHMKDQMVNVLSEGDDSGNILYKKSGKWKSCSTANKGETIANKGETIANKGEDSTESEDVEDYHPVRKSRRRNRGQRYQELINEGIIQLSKERMAALQHPDKKEESPDEDVQPIHAYNSYVLPETAIRRIRKRTTSESAKDKIFHHDDVKRYKTGDFDLEAEIAILPACSVENMGRKRGFARQRHSSECIHTHRKLSESDTLSLPQPVFNVEKIVTLPPRNKVMPETSQEPVVGSRKRKARKHSITHMVPAPATLIKNGKVKPEVSGLGPCLIKPSETILSDKKEHNDEVAMKTDKFEHSICTETCSIATKCDKVTDGQIESNVCDKTKNVIVSDCAPTGCDLCLFSDSHSSPKIETQSGKNPGVETQSRDTSISETQSGNSYGAGTQSGNSSNAGTQSRNSSDVETQSKDSSCAGTQSGNNSCAGAQSGNSSGAERESLDTVCPAELLATMNVDKNCSTDTKISDKNEALHFRTGCNPHQMNSDQIDNTNEVYKSMRKKETDVNSNNTINCE